VPAVHKLRRVGLYPDVVAGLGLLALKHPLADELLYPAHRNMSFGFYRHISHIYTNASIINHRLSIINNQLRFAPG
jgi:hypothetical protein